MTTDISTTRHNDRTVALCYPDVLPHAAVAELGLDTIAYDRLGPVLYCPCQRRTSYNAALRRRCLVTRRGVMYIIRSLQDDAQDRGDRSVVLVDDCTVMVDPSHIVDLSLGHLSVAFHTSTRLTADNERVEHETEFAITLLPPPGGGTPIDDAPLTIRMLAVHGSTLRRVMSHFAASAPNLCITEQPHAQDSPVSPLKRLRGIVKSFRKTPSVTTRLGGTSTADVFSSAVGRVAGSGTASGVHNLLRPKGLRHHAPEELVPLDALKRRPPMPPEELDAIRSKLMNIYAFYAPHKAHTVPDLMLKYRGLEDLLLVKVVAMYGGSTLGPATARGPLTPLQNEDANSSALATGGAQQRDDDGDYRVMTDKSVVMGDISDIDAFEEEDDSRRNQDETIRDGAATDDIEDLLLEVSVLERSCDRLAWTVAANKTAIATTTKERPSIVSATRTRALALAQIVMSICTIAVKQDHLATEDGMSAMYMHAGVEARRAGGGNASSPGEVLPDAVVSLL